MVPFLHNIPPHEKRITFSTLLTILRIVLIPAIVYAIVVGKLGSACIFFVIASITDILDGYLARTWNEQTLLGAALDPLADKLLLLTCFTTLACVPTQLFTIPAWFVCFVFLREAIILLGAVLVYTAKGSLIIKPTLLGKMTTCVEILFIVWLFIGHYFQWMPRKSYYAALIIMFMMLMISCIQYIVVGWQQYKK